MTDGKRLGVHIIMDDPAGNSYLQVSYVCMYMCVAMCACICVCVYESEHQQNLTAKVCLYKC